MVRRAVAGALKVRPANWVFNFTSQLARPVMSLSSPSILVHACPMSHVAARCLCPMWLHAACSLSLQDLIAVATDAALELTLSRILSDCGSSHSPIFIAHIPYASMGTVIRVLVISLLHPVLAI